MIFDALLDIDTIFITFRRQGLYLCFLYKLKLNLKYAFSYLTYA